MCFAEGLWQQVFSALEVFYQSWWTLGPVGPPAGLCQPCELAGPPGRSTCFRHWTWQADECWEEGICLICQFELCLWPPDEIKFNIPSPVLIPKTLQAKACLLYTNFELIASSVLHNVKHCEQIVGV